MSRNRIPARVIGLSMMVLLLELLPGGIDAWADCPLGPFLFGPTLANNCNTVELEWDAVPSATSYEVEAKRQGSGSNAWVYKGTTNGRFFTVPVSELSRGETWEFRIKAFVGVCIPYSTLSYIPIPLEPLMPTGITVTAPSPGQIRISWYVPPQYPSQNVLVYRDGIITDISAGFGVGQVTFPEDCSPHFYELQSKSAPGECLSEISPTHLAPLSPPTLTSPSNGAILAPVGSIQFAWQVSGGCSGLTHTIQIDDSPLFTAPVLETASPPGLSHTWTAPIAGVYYWRVKSCSSPTNCSVYSPNNTFTVPISVTSPAGGVVWAPGTTQSVQWVGGGPVKIELLLDAIEAGSSTSPSVVLLASTPSSPATVTVPAGVASTRARVRVSRDFFPSTVMAESPVIKVVAPPPPNVYAYSAIDVPQSGAGPSDLCSNGAGGVESVYFDATPELDLKWASRVDKTQAAWTVKPPIDTQGSVGLWPAIVRGSDGRLHVAYYDNSSGSAKLYYKVWNGTVWSQRVLVKDVMAVAGDCAIALDGSGVPHIAFNSGDLGGYPNWRKVLVYKQQPNLTWAQDGPSFSASESPQHLDLKFGGGQLWLTYLDLGRARLNLGLRTPSGWIGGQVDMALTPYTFTDVSLGFSPDAPFRVYLAYSAPNYGEGGGQRLYFQPFGANGDALAAPITVDASVGNISSISMRCPAGSPARIAYAQNGVIKLATGSSAAGQWPSTWSVENVDISGNMDSQVSLAITSGNERWITYRDVGTGSLRSATPSGVDITPPAPTPYLTAQGSCDDYLTVSWQATGDDGTVGQATSFDLKWSYSPINSEAAFSAASAVLGIGAPGPNGTPHSRQIEVGECSTGRYFALKIRDEMGNLSPYVATATPAATACPGPLGCFGEEGAAAASGPVPVTAIRSVGPSPAFGPVTIAFGVGEADARGTFELSIFDIAGRRVTQIEGENPGAGFHDRVWTLTNDRGENAGAGFYFVRLQTNGPPRTHRILVMR